MDKNFIANICIFCGSKSGKNAEIENCIKDLAEALIKNKYSLIYGGGSTGLMGKLADSGLKKNGTVIGVIPEFLLKKEVGNLDLEILIVTKNMHQRKQTMYERADAFIIYPGGIGTLDEFFEILTWKQLGLHVKPIIILDINKFWTPLIDLINHQIYHKFLDKKILDDFTICKEVNDAISFLNKLNLTRKLE